MHTHVGHDSFWIAFVIEIVIAFVMPTLAQINFTIGSTTQFVPLSLCMYMYRSTLVYTYTHTPRPPSHVSPPLPLTRSGNEEEDDGPGGSALEHNYQPTLDRAYCEGIPPRTGPQGQGGLRPADPYQAWAPVRISPRYLHVVLTVLKSLSNTL